MTSELHVDGESRIPSLFALYSPEPNQRMLQHWLSIQCEGKNNDVLLLAGFVPPKDGVQKKALNSLGVKVKRGVFKKISVYRWVRVS